MQDRNLAESMAAPGGGPHRRPVRLQARGITKTYGGRPVLSGVDLVVHAGEAVAVVGANGAGKSMFLKICAGLVSPDSGEVVVNGRLGYCPQEIGLFGFLMPDEHFTLFGAGRGLTRQQARRRGRRIAAQLDWDARVRTQVRHLSGGTQQKLNLTLAMLGDVDVLLLDEPYQGFDRGSYIDFWHHLGQWRDAGKAVVVITHMLDSLERVDRVLELSATERSGR
jgi:ABC-type multidrug transport system, ATPase component